ncbi:MAG: transcriptional repressor [Gammaproteobacteria bacterium]|nr:MAG: transcriptional repressor [Gammaproteobacteria bacterium]
MDALNLHSERELTKRLEFYDIKPTPQRVKILRLLYMQSRHVSAEEVFAGVNEDVEQGRRQASKATVYNTLGLFARQGLVKEVIADPARVFYDPNTTPHHHFYNTSTGELSDISAESVAVSGLPPLPPDTELEGIDVVVRLRGR